MSEKLPPDLDRLIWEVAESQDTNAYDDFERRFPQYVAELGKRIKIVRDLRGVGSATSKRPRPRFDGRAPSRVSPSRSTVVGGLVLLTALAFGTFTLTSKMINHREEKITKVDPSQLDTNPQLPTQGAVTYKPIPPPPANSDPNQNQPTQTPPDTGVALNQYDKPQSVKLDRVKLKTALLAVAASGGLQLEFAPNMPNPEIKIQYQGVSAVEILKDLGSKFGFTAFKESEQSILVVPARDPSAPVLPPATGSGYAVSLDDDSQSPTPVERNSSGTVPATPSRKQNPTNSLPVSR